MPASCSEAPMSTGDDPLTPDPAMATSRFPCRAPVALTEPSTEARLSSLACTGSSAGISWWANKRGFTQTCISVNCTQRGRTPFPHLSENNSREELLEAMNARSSLPLLPAISRQGFRVHYTLLRCYYDYGSQPWAFCLHPRRRIDHQLSPAPLSRGGGCRIT